MDFKTAGKHIVLTLALVVLASATLAAQPIYKFHVDGLACPFCAYGIEKKLNALEGVERIEMNIKDGVVVVTMKNGSALDEAVARKAVKDAGFTLNGFERLSPVSEQ
ncbi:MAG: hypothetical protein NMNS01_11800 [Nitrosomonas sp.]|nr:MAG: hypothetical protein NMNS01_11800 [Nitrosomonas sp.]